ncbi:MAG: hypothetical protein HOO96_19385 [Polyangiaceae bacterium]|nr:hypothetical protein [Polyangiaceae bacterium]
MNRGARIDADDEVRAIARHLGIKQRHGLGEAIRDATIGKVESTLTKLGIVPSSISELREVVFHTAGLRVVRIQSDEDLQDAQKKYAPELVGLPKQLELEFSRDTEAVVVRRRQNDALSNNKFVALVDARGDRNRRAWFSEWHEATHTLVPDPANKLVVRRTRLERPEPVEQVIDLTAASIGFWAPIVKPVVREEVAVGEDILKALDDSRIRIAAEASRDAAFRSLSNFVSTPIIVLWVGYDCRAADKDQPHRSLALRARSVIRNDAAIARGLNIPVNFRIPPDSVITTAANSNWDTRLVEDDNLWRWKDSKGRSLGPGAVKVTARGQWVAIEAAG